jgi:hypothetical protein
VAIVGESISHGAEVSHEESPAGLLESRLDANVLNLARPGSNSSIYAAIVDEYLKCLGNVSVAAAIVGLFNDVHVGDIPRIVAGEQFGSRALLDGVSVSRSTYERAMGSWWYRAFFNLQVEARQWSSTYNRLFPPRVQRTFAVPIIGKQTPENLKEWENRIVRHVDDVRAVLRLLPNQMVVWVEPSANELSQHRTALDQRTAMPDDYLIARQFWSRVLGRLASEGYLVVDPQDQVQALFFERRIYPYSTSGHLRPEAYRVISDAVEPQLRRALPVIGLH